MAIDDRKQRILMAIVSLYATGGEPVGSNLLSKHFNMAVSSATLRNEMAALTKLGLLEQPHTSAGRVPTAKGYRYYVDHLLFMPARLAPQDRAMIDALFDGLDNDPEKLAQGAARALANKLGYAVVATTPRAEDSFIAHFEVTQVGRYAVVVLAVTGAGSVLTRVAKVEYELTPADLSALGQAINQSLRFVKDPELPPITLRDIARRLPHGAQSAPVLNAALALMAEARRPRVYFEGQHYLLLWPELEGGLGAILKLMADEEQVAASLLKAGDNRTLVTLGDEMPRPIPGLCVISRQYLAGSGQSGGIAVLGPMRMRFAEVIPKLEYFTEVLGRLMSGAGLGAK